jgi:hypothetical protein
VFLVWVSSFIYSILLPSAFYFCLDLLVIFTTSCSDVRDLLVQQRKQTGDGVKPALQVARVPVSAVTFVPDDYQVSVYFDGAIDRGDVLKVMTGLERDGWQLRKLAQRGGALRSAAAANVNQVRYNPTSRENEAAAIAIAGLCYKRI